MSTYVLRPSYDDCSYLLGDGASPIHVMTGIPFGHEAQARFGYPHKRDSGDAHSICLGFVVGQACLAGWVWKQP